MDITEMIFMDYLYENLGDERFQEFCSCLVSKEFPNVQAFPVGQPDGGRDTVVYEMSGTKKEFIVFQVKFVRNANQERDVHKWLMEIIEGEAKKINKLIPSGAKGYYLLTNVRGTAHPDVGSIDKVNKILSENIKVPSICWWREDLSMLFEKDPMFKWSFPEILNGKDILNFALFNNLNEHRERRENVIRAYLADQYEMDNEVKFKQINLQNRMFSLFTDVPIQIKKLDSKNRKLRRTLETIEHINHCMLFPSEEVLTYGSMKKMCAAEFLLHPEVQSGIRRILLEGGPGQGKSTISQYISQVHRAKLLNKTSDLMLLPDNIKNSPVRLPFKIDLRHVAAWVEKKNPYTGILSEEYFERIWHKSLESFLVGHMYYHSKIEEFNTSDLISVFRLSSILFVFDGFDEIANIEVRQEVIQLINKGINRISENSKSLQVIITSRPAAFSDSIEFSTDDYPHFELADITPTIIQEYVERWIKASKLDSREAAEIRKLSKEKLQLPHLRELAKSPMQLAILISLLRTRGESLPNKRTALYDSYIELFFNREAEKNIIIRDYRDLIIEIHEFLAWVLHSEAELYKNNGVISIEDLKKKLNIYLNEEGHETDITDKLFQVVEERVCALVSRVQGTFEFEVQPLREYFCAKYLYKTSPYSPAGAEKTGTLPDRFAAISRSFYWQNVVRFFAGCFSKGEISMLIQKLRELADDEVLKYTNYPRVITSQLLSDYVFNQYPIHMKDVVKIIIDGINIGNIINQDESSSNNESITLPLKCGRVEVATECFRQLREFPPFDYASELIKIIVNNEHRILESWCEYLPHIKGEQLTLWLEYAYRLQIIHKIDDDVLINILSKDKPTETMKRINIIIDGNRQDIILKNPEYKKITFSSFLNGSLSSLPRGNSLSSLDFVALLNQTFIFSRMIRYKDINAIFFDFISRYQRSSMVDQRRLVEFVVNDEIDLKIKEYLTTIEHIFNLHLCDWRENTTPWECLVENGRRIFNDQWIFYIISTISAGIKPKVDLDDEYGNLSDSSISLCGRARYARERSGNVRYWQAQFESGENLQFKLLLFFTWATPRTLIELSDTVESIIYSLGKYEFSQLADGIRRASYISAYSNSYQKQIIKQINSKPVSDKFKLFLSQRFDYENRGMFIHETIVDSTVLIEETIKLRLEHLVSKYLLDTSNESLLAEIKQIYRKLKKYGYTFYIYGDNHRRHSNKIPIEIAKKIMIDCKEYPILISSLAEKSCKINAYSEIRPVGEIAKQEKWFEETYM
jgi:hypothetical protein